MIPDRKRTVGILATASFLHDIGSDIVFSVWPLFVTGVLGANMSVLGLIDGIGDALVSISQAVSGYLSDKVRKRKVFVWLGYLFGGLARIGYAVSPSWHFLIPFRMLDRSGKIRGSPRDAIISDVSTREDRGKNFGILRTMDNLGAVIGIIISIVFLEKLGFQTLFFLAAIPSVLAVLLIIIFIKEQKPASNYIFKGLRLYDFQPNLRLYTFLSALFSLGAFSYSFLLIAARNSGIEMRFIPVLYLVFTIVAALFSIHFGKLSDKLGRKPILFVAFVLWILVALIFAVSDNFVAVIAAFVLYGLHRASLEPVQKTFISELAPKNYLASTLGGFQMVVGLCSLPASVIAGVLWDRAGISAPFYFSIALTIASLVLLLFVREEKSAV